MVMGSECLDNVSVNVDDWREEIMKEDEVGDENALYTAVSLLSQLPNFKTLQLPQVWQDLRHSEDTEDDNKRLVFVLDAIVECSNSGEGHENALEKLETILPFVPEGYEERLGLQSL
jgi:hypothetical protein